MKSFSNIFSNFSRFKSTARKGFTLIEVVIAMFLLNILGVAIMETIAQIERVQVLAETDMAVSNELKRQIQIVKGIPLEDSTSTGLLSILTVDRDPPAAYTDPGSSVPAGVSLRTKPGIPTDPNGRLWGIIGAKKADGTFLKADVRWYRKTQTQSVTGERTYIVTIVVFMRRLGIAIERRGQVVRTLERGSRIQ
jgi:prepilin-type N-terminal cleavage/methylation domain-containing protein